DYRHGITRGQRHDAITLAVEERFGWHDERVGAVLPQRSESFVQVVLRAGVEHADGNSQSARHGRRFLRVKLGTWTGWIDETGDCTRRRQHFLEQLCYLSDYFRGQQAHAGDVTCRPVETRHETKADRIVVRRKDYRNAR